MRIERMKRWQWMIVGAALGSVVAAVKLWTGPAEPPNTESVAPHVFENQLVLASDPSKRVPYQVGQIVLHPPQEVVVPGSKVLERREVITYHVWFPEKKHKNEKGEGIAKPHSRRVIFDQGTHTRSPYLGDISKLSAREYLNKLKNFLQKLDRRNFKYAQNFEYKYAWLETPKGAYTTYVLGGIVLVGLIWPTVLRRLVGAGYGREYDDADEAYLSRFKGGRTSEEKKKQTGMTADDLAELQRLEAELEAKLKDSGLALTQVAAAAKSTESAAQVAEKAARKFTAAPAEETSRDKAARAAAAAKAFGTDQGDYYPTEVHGKHKQ
jgi:hypothetical protein